MAGLMEGKVALVTGAGAGIGRTAALAFAREKAAGVIVVDREPASGQETLRMTREICPAAIFVAADIARESDVAAMVAQAVATYGRLDCAFNNAGIAPPVVDFVDGGEEDFDQTIAVNLKGTWLCMKYEIRQMLKQGGGSIVNTASNAGMVGYPGMAVYGASKAGIVQLTKTAAVEYARKGIRVNAICPALTATPTVQTFVERFPDFTAGLIDKVPIGRLGQTEEIAQAAVWLCSDRASFITAVPMPVDGGWTNV